jgi:hypothetical protein
MQQRVMTKSVDDDESEERAKRERREYVGSCCSNLILPLHCALLKRQSCKQGSKRKVGPTFHKRVFAKKLVSKFTVQG